MVKFDLPMPPSVNAIYTPALNRKTGHCYIRESSACKSYKQIVKMLLEPDLRSGNYTKFTSDVSIKVQFYFKQSKKNKKCDVDNRFKALLDSLVDAGILADDTLVVHIEGDKIITQIIEKCVVEINSISDNS